MAERRIHFLHLSKTGGSAVKSALRQTRMKGLQLHSHKMNLGDVPRGEGVIFVVRDPITRFVSGFYSRQRQGRPRFNAPWTKPERAAFKTFHTPNALATALSDHEGAVRQAALAAMGAIRHVKWSYYKWFGSDEALAERLDDIVFIGLQEELDADFERLRRRIGIAQDISLPKDDVGAHRNPDNLDRTLSDVALENLRVWYARDIAFYSLCKELRKHLM